MSKATISSLETTIYFFVFILDGIWFNKITGCDDFETIWKGNNRVVTLLRYAGMHKSEMLERRWKASSVVRSDFYIIEVWWF